MDDFVTDEMVEAAHAVIDREIGAECPTPSECAACDAHQAAAAILEAVAPLIAAQALRDAADGVDLSPSYPTPGLSELHNAESAAEAFLRARADELEAGSLAAIQVNGPGLEKSGDNSSLRDRIAEAINGGPLPEPGRDWEADMYQTQADAVIAALGLREERRPGATTTLNDSVWTRPDKHRYITDWEETP